jgi:hypothetical protein
MKVIPFFIIFVETIRYMKFQALKVKTPEEILIVLFDLRQTAESMMKLYFTSQEI